MPRVEKEQETTEQPVVSREKSKSVKLRSKRFMTVDAYNVQIKLEPAKDPKTGKFLKDPETGAMIGKVIELKQDMWKDKKCFAEVVNSLLKNKYVEPVMEVDNG